jgi:hypothetical protein
LKNIFNILNMANPGTELASLDFGNLIGGPLVAVVHAQSLAADATTMFIKKNGFYPDQLDTAGNVIAVGAPIYVDFKYPKEIQPYQPALPIGTIINANITIAGEGYSDSQVVTVSFSAGDGETAAEGTVIADATGNIPSGTSIAITNPGSYLSGTVPSATIPATQADGTTAVTTGATSTGSDITYIAPHNPIPAIYQEMKIAVPLLTMLPIPFIKVDIITIDFNAKINSMETSSSSSDTVLSGGLSASYGGKRANVSFNGSASYKRSNASGSSVERTYSMSIHVQASQDEMPAGMEKLLNILEGAMKSTPGNILPATT